MEDNVLEEIVACERMTHKNLTKNLHVLYQLIYYLLERKKPAILTWGNYRYFNFLQPIIAITILSRDSSSLLKLSGVLTPPLQF